MSEQSLEKFCDSIVDVLTADLRKGQYFVRAFKGKNKNIYLRIKQKQGRIVKKN